MSLPFISGLSFYKISKWSFCPRYPLSLYQPNDIKENDIIFLNLEHFGEFIRVLYQQPPRNRFVLITHNSDKLFNDEYFRAIEPFVNKVYAINNICKKPNVFTIPIGFRDHPYDTMNILKTVPTCSERSILLYMNFELNTNREKRTQCLNWFIDLPWVEKEGFIKEQALPLHEFYSKIAKTKYILSPEGTGIDCHRVYEAIYLNAIPILKTNAMDNYYKHLPVIIVEDWSEITYEYLNNNYETQFNKLMEWKNNNPEWLTAKFWLDSFNK